MKVLVKGRPQKGWSVEAVCTGEGNGKGGCGAKLLVEEDDVFKTQASVMGEVTWYITFRCPECQVLTDLDDSDRRTDEVPAHVWAKAPNKFMGDGEVDL